MDSSKKLSWLPRAALIGATGVGAVWAVIQVPPDELRSSAAKWADALGWPRLASWIDAHPPAPWIFLIVGAGVMYWAIKSGDIDRIVSRARKIWHNLNRDTHVADIADPGDGWKPSPTAARSAPSVDPLAGIAPPARPLTPEERQFLSDICKLVALLDITHGLLTIVYASMREHYAVQNGQAAHRALHYFFCTSTDALAPAVRDLNHHAQNVTTPTDLDDLVGELRTFMLNNYRMWQLYIFKLNEELGIDLPNNTELKNWLEKEERCVDELRAIKLSPMGALKLDRFPDQAFGSLGKKWKIGE